MDDTLYLIGRGIVREVFFLRARSGKIRPFDKIRVTHEIHKHFEQGFGEWPAALSIVPDWPGIHFWCADYAMEWYRWAMSGLNCLSPNLLNSDRRRTAAGPEIVPSGPEESIDSEPILVQVEPE
jgi:hypothetical protein